MALVSVTAIMLDEEIHFPRWIAGLMSISEAFDEIVVVDGGSTDRTRELFTAQGLSQAQTVPMSWFSFPWIDDYSVQRNHACREAKHDWVFEIDADETPSKPLLAGLRQIAVNADAAGIDAIGIPRLNFIDGTLVASPGHRGLDFQYRLHRRDCRWHGRVHEELRNHRSRFELSVPDGHFLVHEKTRQRHETQNAYYKTLESR